MQIGPTDGDRIMAHPWWFMVLMIEVARVCTMFGCHFVEVVSHLGAVNYSTFIAHSLPSMIVMTYTTRT